MGRKRWYEWTKTSDATQQDREYHQSKIHEHADLNLTGWIKIGGGHVCFSMGVSPSTFSLSSPASDPPLAIASMWSVPHLFSTAPLVMSTSCNRQSQCYRTRACVTQTIHALAVSNYHHCRTEWTQRAFHQGVVRVFWRLGACFLLMKTGNKRTGDFARRRRPCFTGLKFKVASR